MIRREAILAVFSGTFVGRFLLDFPWTAKAAEIKPFWINDGYTADEVVDGQVQVKKELSMRFDGTLPVDDVIQAAFRELQAVTPGYIREEMECKVEQFAYRPGAEEKFCKVIEVVVTWKDVELIRDCPALKALRGEPDWNKG